jgi:hypothetical protein
LRAAGRRHVYRDGSFPGAAAKLIEELRFEAAGIENRLEPAPGEFLNLLVRQLHAASLRDTRANLAHDLFDVYAVSTFRTVPRIRRRTLPAFGSAPIGTAAAAMKVPAASLVVIHRHRVSTL